MSKVIVIYRAPEGDNKVVEMGGVTFFDGQETELDTDDNSYILSKLAGNQHFEVGGEAKKADKPRLGRPPNVLKTGHDD